MASASIAVQNTLQWEGGYSENSADPGGTTNMGILQSDVPQIPIENLTMQQAIEYYIVHYWKPLYAQIESQAVASKLFDMGVLFGVVTATALLQEVLQIPHDGIFGPDTLQELNEHGDNILPAYRTRLIEHSQNVVTAKPETNIFLAGWIRRING